MAALTQLLVPCTGRAYLCTDKQTVEEIPVESIDMASIKKNRGLLVVLLVLILAILQYHFVSQKWVSRRMELGETVNPRESMHPYVQAAGSGMIHPKCGRAL